METPVASAVVCCNERLKCLIWWQNIKQVRGRHLIAEGWHESERGEEVEDACIGTGCPENLWMSPPWGCSRHVPPLLHLAIPTDQQRQGWRQRGVDTNTLASPPLETLKCPLSFLAASCPKGNAKHNYNFSPPLLIFFSNSLDKIIVRWLFWDQRKWICSLII